MLKYFGFSRCQINCREYINPDDNIRYLGTCTTCNINDEVMYAWEYQMYDDLTDTFDSVTLPSNPHIIKGEISMSIRYIYTHLHQRGYVFGCICLSVVTAEVMNCSL